MTRGQYDWRDMMSAADFEALRNAHRPSDAAAIEREIRRLSRTGLTEIDISVALRVDLALVRNVMGEGRAA